MDSKVYRRTILDELYDYWNGHIHQQIAHEINYRTLKKMGEKDIWEYQNIKMPGTTTEVNKPIMAKDILPKIEQSRERNLMVLQTIASMIKEAEEIKFKQPYGNYGEI